MSPGMSYKSFGDGLPSPYNESTWEPQKTTPYAEQETAQQKRDRLSREENKRIMEARRRGGKVRFNG